jgi:hypothetical protein
MKGKSNDRHNQRPPSAGAWRSVAFLQRKDENMGHDAQDRNERESTKSHQASVEIADALARMFVELKPKIMAKYV